MDKEKEIDTQLKDMVKFSEKHNVSYNQSMAALFLVELFKIEGELRALRKVFEDKEETISEEEREHLADILEAFLHTEKNLNEQETPQMEFASILLMRLRE
jgi:ATP phosphoribosyltransferase regulatory subunit HisZ